MSSHVWCHGTKYHKSRTQDRVRGSKGSKVLRTRKVKQHTNSQWYSPNDVFNYFCSQGCLMDFMKTHIQRVIALDPRTEPLETLINDPTKNTDHHYYSSWNITEKGIDNTTE